MSDLPRCKVAIITEICSALSDDRPDTAREILQEQYPFVSATNVARRYSVRQMLGTFMRDGFIDRYSGERLVCVPTLRLISRRLPDEFPFQANWRMDSCHIAFWELSPTVDHVLPVSRGGADDESNWVTTSMVRNSAKANFTLDELKWTLYPPGSMKDWDGMLGWFVAEVSAQSAFLSDSYLRQWFTVAKQLLAAPA